MGVAMEVWVDAAVTGEAMEVWVVTAVMGVATEAWADTAVMGEATADTVRLESNSDLLNCHRKIHNN